MILSCLIPVGPIKRLSYQYNVETVLAAAASAFDKVYVVSNSRETTELPCTVANVVLRSGPDTWFDVDENGAEVVVLVKQARNMQVLVREAARAGDDFLLLLDINQYLDPQNADRLRRYCETLRESHQPWGYRYGALQIAEFITYPRMRHPWLFDLQHADCEGLRIEIDAISTREGELRAERGLFKNAPFYVTDIFPPVWTKKDYEEKFEYYIKHVHRHYGREPVCDWETHVLENNNKANQSVVNPDAELSAWGRQVLANIPTGSIYERMDFAFAKGVKRLRDVAGVSGTEDRSGSTFGPLLGRWRAREGGG